MPIDLDKIKKQSKRARKKRNKEARKKRKRERLDENIDDWHKENAVQPILDLLYDFKRHVRFFETLNGNMIDPPETLANVESEFCVERFGVYSKPRKVATKIRFLLDGYIMSVTAQSESDYLENDYKVRYWYNAEWHLHCRDEITDMLLEHYLPHATPESIDRFAEKTDWIE